MATIRVPLIPLVLASFLATSLGALGAASAGVKVGSRAPELVGAKDARGHRAKLRAYRGKWVLITFGASWCKPCKKELPAWEGLAEKYKAAGANIVFIAVNIDSKIEKGKKFVKQAKLRAMHPVFDPSGSSVDTWEPPAMPSTFVIGPKGIVRHVHKGYKSGQERQLRSKLDKLMKK